jgi:hypothetical protein
MSCQSLMRPSDASYWPITHGGKKVTRGFFVLKMIQQHMNNWEVGKLFLQCIVIPNVDVTPFKYGWIYNIFSYDNWYDITIGNFQDLHMFTLSKCWQVLWVVMGHMCNENMWITSCRQFFWWAHKRIHLLLYRVMMKFYVC